MIPCKDARADRAAADRELRREWRRRIIDHDGDARGQGGIERWLKLAEGLGLDRAYVDLTEGILPATRFAVEAYVRLRARASRSSRRIASSLTEMFSPGIIAERVAGMLANYDFITDETLAYFTPRLTQAPQRRRVRARATCKAEAQTRAEQQQAVLAALRFKCDVLWAQLDALLSRLCRSGPDPARRVRAENERERQQRPWSTRRRVPHAARRTSSSASTRRGSAGS